MRKRKDKRKIPVSALKKERIRLESRRKRRRVCVCVCGWVGGGRKGVPNEERREKLRSTFFFLSEVRIGFMKESKVDHSLRSFSTQSGPDLRSRRLTRRGHTI